MKDETKRRREAADAARAHIADHGLPALMDLPIPPHLRAAVEAARVYPKPTPGRPDPKPFFDRRKLPRGMRWQWQQERSVWEYVGD